MASSAAADGPTSSTERPIPLPFTEVAPLLEQGLANGAWSGAFVDSTFFEINVGDVAMPPAATTVYLLHTPDALFVAFHLLDPSPEALRSFVTPRDQVFSSQDFVQVEVDPSGEGRDSRLFRVNANGVQGDGTYTESTGSDDFGPDFDFETATRVREDGWRAAYRIPMRALPGGRLDPTWRVILFRSYPRGEPYQMASVPIPREATCWLCYGQVFGLSSAVRQRGGWSLRPYTAFRSAGSSPGERGVDAGLDAEARSSRGFEVAMTLNPDFSQVEADVPQLEANLRFALDYPEKRPFFLEGADHFATPMPVLRTRSLVDPRWGARMNLPGRAIDLSVVAAEDLGGGSRLLPGATGSERVPNDERSEALLGRVAMRKIGAWSPGLSVSLREEPESGAFNRVVGPDLKWQPTRADLVMTQAILTDTREPAAPATHPSLDGQRFSGAGWLIQWRHAQPRLSWEVEHSVLDDAVRAESGFLPQVGTRSWRGGLRTVMMPNGWVRRAEPEIGLGYVEGIDGRPVERTPYAKMTIQAPRGILLSTILHPADEVRFQDALFQMRFVEAAATIRPDRRLSRLEAQFRAGQDLDVDDGRLVPGTRTAVRLTANLTNASELLLDVSVETLDVRDGTGAAGRLQLLRSLVAQVTQALTATAHVRMRWTHQFASRDSLLDAQGEGVRARSDNLSALLSVVLGPYSSLLLGGELQSIEDDVTGTSRTERVAFAKLTTTWNRRGSRGAE